MGEQLELFPRLPLARPPKLAPSRTRAGRAVYSRRYNQAYKLTGSGILSKRALEGVEPDSHCGLDVFDVSGDHAPMTGWIVLESGCYQATAEDERGDDWRFEAASQDDTEFGRTTIVFDRRTLGTG